MVNPISAQEIDRKRGELEALAKKIWENPETAFNEKKACEWTAELLEKEGFTVERNYVGIPTALRATWGSGSPVIGFLGEYDALPDMSQKIGFEKEPIQEGAPGQGCGHNLLGTAHVAAVIGAKKEMEEKGLSGTLVFYGCPAEEVLTGKGYMARNGAFRDLDIFYAFHPWASYIFTEGRMVGLNTAKFHFKGTTAHAGGDPENGRSALDAAELMSVGTNYLREHVTPDVKMHYAYTDVIGAPNVVPDRTTVWYYVRALSREAVEDTYQRLIKVAKGAAMMTETEVEVEYLGGCYNSLQNKVLLKVIRDSAVELGPIEWTPEEIEEARKLNEVSDLYKRMIANGADPAVQLETTIQPIVDMNFSGSSDVGDVEHIVPGVFFMAPTMNIGGGSHTWQVVVCSGNSIGMHGMLEAGKVMALSAIKAIEDPSIIEAAKKEFAESMNGKEYVCPITDDMPIPSN